jgi:predicted RNA-binding protein with PIN domain
MLWITRPDGWETAARTLLADGDAPDAHASDADARTERRRREAAEAASLRARHDAVEAVAALQREREMVAALTTERDRLAEEVTSVRRQLDEMSRAVRKREAGARVVDERSAATAEELSSLRTRLVGAESARDAALAARAAAPMTTDHERLRSLLVEAVSLLAEPGAARKRRAVRSPIAVPGGLYGDSEAAGRHLLQTPEVLVLVDGYNVAMLGWPELSLEHQRDRCVQAAETIARRWGTEVHVVFDGADIVGAHGPGRRLVRVSFSAPGVTADDVLRAEVAAVDSLRPVVVVTNDQAIIGDVRAAGANTLASGTFLAVARR